MLKYLVSNWVTPLARARLGKSTVRHATCPEPTTTKLGCAIDSGALNWATGETVAIKEIQLSNIPKSEIGQIMVRVVFEYDRNPVG